MVTFGWGISPILLPTEPLCFHLSKSQIVCHWLTSSGKHLSSKAPKKKPGKGQEGPTITQVGRNFLVNITSDLSGLARHFFSGRSMDRRILDRFLGGWGWGLWHKFSQCLWGTSACVLGEYNIITTYSYFLPRCNSTEGLELLGKMWKRWNIPSPESRIDAWKWSISGPQKKQLWLWRWSCSCPFQCCWRGRKPQKNGDVDILTCWFPRFLLMVIDLGDERD